jgi:hypothetical protein
MNQPNNQLPVAIVGGGPIGLAAGAHLVEKGEKFVLFEAGDAVGDSISKWAHVRVFTPWRYLVDAAAKRLLLESGWLAPSEDELPTGRELIEYYLLPLSRLPEIKPHIRLQSDVTAISRQGFDKMKSAGRENAPFAVQVRSRHEGRSVTMARAVIDASGTYRTPNPLGGNGLPALGEPEATGQVFFGIPNTLDADRERFADHDVLVVGNGHSAFSALLELAKLQSAARETRLFWAIRGAKSGRLFGGEQNDELPARGALGSAVRELIETGKLTLLTDYRIERLERGSNDKITVTSDSGVKIVVDQIICATGYRPELNFVRELRIGLEPTVESPPLLAPMIDPNVHSCGSVPPHGARELAHPEPDFYIVGMKSYGRAPTFLMLTGYEQVRSVVCALTGDLENASAVQLTLPETGVCSTDLTCEADSEHQCGCSGVADERERPVTVCCQR